MEGKYRRGEFFSHPAISKTIYTILREAHVIIQCDEEHKKVFSSLPKVSFRRAKTLKDFLVRSKLSNFQENKISCERCGRSNCQVCNFLDLNNTFDNMDGSKTFLIVTLTSWYIKFHVSLVKNNVLVVLLVSLEHIVIVKEKAQEVWVFRKHTFLNIF